MQISLFAAFVNREFVSNKFALVGFFQCFWTLLHSYCLSSVMFSSPAAKWPIMVTSKLFRSSLLWLGGCTLSFDTKADGPAEL